MCAPKTSSGATAIAQNVRSLLRATIWLASLFLTAAHAATPAISAGGRGHSIALSADGTIRTWGIDSSGQLGVGRSLESSKPLVVTGATAINKIASGDWHVVALKADGSVLAWGSNGDGQLGDGTRVNRSSPVPVSGLAGVVEISARSHTVALKGDGSVWTWGSNGGGALGNRSSADPTTPAQVNGLMGVRAISAGGAISDGGGFTLALKNDGSVWAWGRNDFGQLGDGTKTDPYAGRATPAPVGGLSAVMAISAGIRHSLALKADGTVWAWGNNSAGQLGDGTTIDRPLPVPVLALGGEGVIVAGFGRSFAIKKSDGSVWAWGGNGDAELGDGTYIDRPTPIPLSGLNTATAIATGLWHSVARLANGTIAAWGVNGSGQLGDGTVERRFAPAPVIGITGVLAVAAGFAHTVALKADGSVIAWGDNSAGQLGNGALLFRTTPIVVGLSDVRKISAGYTHTVALKSDGSVFAWGYNGFGQVGDGTNYINRSAPVAVSGLNASSGVIEIAAGEGYTLARKSDGSVWAWGQNGAKLGDRSNPDSKIPAQVNGLTGVDAIAAGSNHSVALKGDGSVWAWGDAGLLGDGTTVDRSTPAPVSGLTGVRAIAAANGHTHALKDDGSVWAWGFNRYGQLGDGTYDDRLTPVQVRGLTDVTAIAAGGVHTLALKGDGSVYELGADPPVQVPGLVGVTAIATGIFHSLAMKSDGSVLAWGENESGRLGDGTLANRSVPVVVVRDDGAGSVAANNWFLDLNAAIAKTIPAEKIPVFLAVVSSAANDLTASIKYRAADVGSSGSVYVFALAPANLVKNVAAETAASHTGIAARAIRAATTPAAPLPCVLAQLSASGQLTAVTAGTLQAYLSGVLSSQGASVSVLNGVSTALLSGSVFYVGYGTNSTSMINGGTNQSVVAIPGAQTCQPQAPQTAPALVPCAQMWVTPGIHRFVPGISRLAENRPRLRYASSRLRLVSVVYSA